MAGWDFHFFPGYYRMEIYDAQDGSRIKSFAARGGKSDPNSTDKIMKPGKTTAGQYVIISVKPYATETWPMSIIPWGTPIKDSGTDILYFDGMRWKSFLDRLLANLARRGMGGATKDQYRKYIIEAYQDTYGKKLDGGSTPWMLNDFGPIAIRYVADANKNRKADKGERLMGEMMHTTPPDEAVDAAGRKVDANVMTDSHGCIHMPPAEMRWLTSNKAKVIGSVLTVHKYTDDPTAFTYRKPK